MIIIHTVAELKMVLKDCRKSNKTIGFVPTMGYLHQGHLTLMRKAKAEQDIAVASIFVNPMQFGPNEDFAVYPRDLERDGALAESAGVDILFAPSVEEMYPHGYAALATTVEVSQITGKLCGASRPGHFRGVTTVVTKLFNIVQPDVAYFGQKDAQQVAVIRQMVDDLNIQVKIVAVPIVREEDGLALSSRNIFLSPQERQAALVLHESLTLAEEMLTKGERNAVVLTEAISERIKQQPLASIDYIAVCHPRTLEDLTGLADAALIALAVRIGKTRLIDNMVWGDA